MQNVNERTEWRVFNEWSGSRKVRQWTMKGCILWYLCWRVVTRAVSAEPGAVRVSEFGKEWEGG
jgi:hypothetical protein